MNYAEKELREAMAYLDEARANLAAIQSIQRALQLGDPVQVTFRSTRATVTALTPSKASEKLLLKLEDQATERVANLEKQEVYWCQEVAHVDKQRQLNLALREEPNKNLNDFRAEEEQAMQGAGDAHAEYQRQQGQSTPISSPA
jgi:hypothetical protein